MTLGAYIRLVLTQDAAVAALAGDRVWSDLLPQKPALPAAVLSLVSGDRDVTLEGWHGVAAQRVQIDAWATTRAQAVALGQAILAVMAGHAGAAGGLEVQGSVLVLERWDYEPDTKLFRVTQDFEVHVAG